jgi:LysR family transcriptional regulator for bpeEF and oprC
VDRLRGVIAFLRTVENRSFVEAAKVLGLTPSAVSKAVVDLESMLGAQLQIRSTRRLTVTEEGVQFYRSCRDAVVALDEAEREVTAASADPRGTLRVNVHTNIGRSRLVPALAGFLARYPRVRLDVSMTSGPLNLIEEGVDVVIRILQPPPSDLVGKQIGRTRFITCASPVYLKARGVPTHPRHLREHVCLLYTLPEGKPYDVWTFKRRGRTEALSIDGPLRLNDGHALADTAIAGAGIVHLIEFTVERHLASGMLVPILEGWHAEGPPIYMLYAKSRHLPAKVRAFAAYAAGLFESVVPKTS